MTLAAASALATPLTTGLSPSELRASTGVDGVGRAVDPERDRQIRQAAQQFEGLLIQQLLGVMRSTMTDGAMFGEGAGSEMYAQMFDQQVGTALAEAGGMGLANVFAQAMGGSATPPSSAPLSTLDALAGMDVSEAGGIAGRTAASGAFAAFARHYPIVANRPVSGVALPGMTGALQDAARTMIPTTGVAPQWGRDGRLTHADLASDIQTEGPDGVARFAVDDARGFEGYYKCNLFAMELARRAGFEVPLVGRHAGWGYIGPTAVANDAADGRVHGDWATVATNMSADELDSAIVRGDRAFLLSGSEAEGHRGHMGIVERVHEIQRDDAGHVTRIVFDGWEGRSRGAMHLVRRTWNVVGHAGGHMGEDSTGAPVRPRSGLGSIEILELQRPDPGQRPEHTLHHTARPSRRDLPSADLPTGTDPDG